MVNGEWIYNKGEHQLIKQMLTFQSINGATALSRHQP